MKNKWIGYVGILCSLIFISCSAVVDDPPETLQDSKVPLSSLHLKSSNQCDGLKGYIEASWAEQFTWIPGNFAVIDSTEGDGSIAIAADTTPDDVSQTNIQEPGVDEADWVKTDGDGNFYVVDGEFLVIEQGFPPEELGELSRLNLEAIPRALYLDKETKRVMVIAKKRPLVISDIKSSDAAAQLFLPPPQEFELIFIDVADLNDPVITERLVLEGYSIGSRRVGDRVHLVSRFRIPLPEALQDPSFQDLIARYREAARNGESEEVEARKEEIQTAVHNVVKLIPSEDFLPNGVRVVDGVGQNVSLLSCGDVLQPGVKVRPALLLITSIDIDGSNPSAVGIMNNAWLVYASKEHFYVSQRSGGWFWRVNQSQQTAIYKFKISDAQPQYLATGSIDGWVKDQFSFSEFEGFLRVASTEFGVDQETNRRQTYNHLFVLEDQGGGTLAVIGSARGFGLNERIFAVGFLEERGFIVTFRRIDPLFAFDLSDPFDPILVGELEIPGFSTYIHPIGRDHLLTVGRIRGNLQLQLFDVSDLANPTLLHRYTPPGAFHSFTGAAYDHRAFTYYSPRDLLVIPMMTQSGSSYFSGMVAFRVSLTEGFTELGRVDHADLAKQVYCKDILPEEAWRSEACKDGRNGWWATPRRSVIMTSEEETYLYTISNIGIKATPVETPATVLGSVLFPLAHH